MVLTDSTLYLFDVDGTLTPSRSAIDPEFGLWFLDFCKTNTVCLVTGSDYKKTVEQVGFNITTTVLYSFNCLGNTVYQNHNLIHQNNWDCPASLLDFLQSCIVNSKYLFRYANHFEARPGMLNFSVLGRSATANQRKDYYKWDYRNHERKNIVENIKKYWPNVSAFIGGEISIDIVGVNYGKQQIVSWFNDERIVFFGDKIAPGGNDFDLAEYIVNNKLGTVYNVKNWHDTQKILQHLDTRK